MPGRCFLYYITDRHAFSGDENARRRCLLEKIAEASRCGVDYIQLREKDLAARELEQLVREALRVIRDNFKPRMETGSLVTNRDLATALLINSRTDIALATRADGVHLRSVDVAPTEVRAIWRGAASTEGGAAILAGESATREPIVAVSCHTGDEVVQATSSGANFAVFGPVFKKNEGITRPTGLAALHRACQARIPVLALGGVTLENAQSCLEAGAAGLAAIRLFQESDIPGVVQKLHKPSHFASRFPHLGAAKL